MMKAVFVLLIASVTSRASKSSKTFPEVSRSHLDRVARLGGGTKIAAGDAPFAVRLEIMAPRLLPWNCAGSIVSENWVMTAGHCVGDYMKYDGVDVFIPSHGYAVTVIAGEVSKDVTEADEQRVGVQQVFINRKYDHDNVYNDIAMLLLDTPLKLSANVAAVTLGSKLPDAGAAITCVGWGTTHSGDLSRDLLKIEYVMTPEKNCSEAYPDGFWTDDWKFPKDQFCTGYWDMKKHHAPGDSGGPLFVKSGATFTQYGIVSWGDDSNNWVNSSDWTVDPGGYDVNTDVTQFLSWISEIQTVAKYGALMKKLTANDTKQKIAWTNLADSNYAYQSYNITGTPYIQIKITKFQFPGNHDMLTIFDGPSPNSTIIVQLHYNDDWSSKDSYVSSTSSIFVVIRTDKGQSVVNSAEFTYQAVTKTKKFSTECNTGWTACCDLKQCYQSKAFNDSNSDCMDESDEPSKVNKTCSGGVSVDGGRFSLVLAFLAYVTCIQWMY